MTKSTEGNSHHTPLPLPSSGDPIRRQGLVTSAFAGSTLSTARPEILELHHGFSNRKQLYTIAPRFFKLFTIDNCFLPARADNNYILHRSCSNCFFTYISASLLLTRVGAGRPPHLSSLSYHQERELNYNYHQQRNSWLPRALHLRSWRLLPGWSSSWSSSIRISQVPFPPCVHQSCAV